LTSKAAAKCQHDRHIGQIGQHGRRQNPLRKEAAKAPLSLLKDTDHFGMLTFNFNASWVLKPQLVVDRPSILKAIDEIGVGGETNLYPAMKEAFAALQTETDEIKHIIVLSDGRTLTDDFAGLTKQMADERITVSTVSVGQEADRELMSKIATWGKGKTYYAEDPAGVPQIFNQDVESSAGEALQELRSSLSLPARSKHSREFHFNLRRGFRVTFKSSQTHGRSTARSTQGSSVAGALAIRVGQGTGLHIRCQRPMGGGLAEVERLLQVLVANGT
jgi:hypothetical protein